MKALFAILLLVAASVHAQTFTTPQINSDWTATNTAAQILNKPTTLSGYGITDGVSSATLTAALAGKFNVPTGTTSQYLRGDGTAAMLPTTTVFDFSQPTARTLTLSTSLQATNTAKAAILYPSLACQNATTVLAASGCTMQVRMGTGTLTCSTGTVYYTQSLTVSLGVLITQSSTNPVPILLPIGGSFILCPTTGTFTVTAIEQSAG